MGRTLSSNPITKEKKTFHYSEHDDTYVIHHQQDVEDTIEQNKALYNSFRGEWEPHAEWGDRVASIPPVIWADLIRQGIAYDEKRLRKWLDDRDNLFIRTRPGRLSK